MLFKRKEEYKNIIKDIYSKDRLTRYAQFLFGITLVALSYNIFVLPNNIVYGVGGVGVILNKLYGVDPSIVLLIGSIILIMMSLIVFGINKTKSTIIGAILYPIFVKLTENIPGYVNIGDAEPLVKALFGAVLTGFGSGLIFKAGYSTGGTSILNDIVSKYGKISFGTAMIFTDGLLVLCGVIAFGWTKLLYSVINLYIISIMTDKVILGISQSKSFYIITCHETAVKSFILNDLGHGVTVLEGRGAFTGNHQKVLMCVIPTREYFVVKEGIHEIDKDAFFVVSDAYEVKGIK